LRSAFNQAAVSSQPEKPSQSEKSIGKPPMRLEQRTATLLPAGP
jgi:hypothetical protein